MTRLSALPTTAALRAPPRPLTTAGVAAGPEVRGLIVFPPLGNRPALRRGPEIRPVAGLDRPADSGVTGARCDGQSAIGHGWCLLADGLVHERSMLSTRRFCWLVSHRRIG